MAIRQQAGPGDGSGCDPVRVLVVVVVVVVVVSSQHSPKFRDLDAEELDAPELHS